MRAPERQARDRALDPERAALGGLGAEQEVHLPARAHPVPSPAGSPDPDLPTYYGLPALKPPPWKAYVPLYLYVGGVAGAGAVLGAVAPLDPALRPLARRARWAAALGVPIGTLLLVVDMGRPSRFLYVLRVFRPTSVINLGSWLLSACGVASVAAVVLPGRLADAASLAAGATGPLVATYTGALLSNTAVPLWRRSRRALPFLFAASAVGSTACLLLPFAATAREAQVLRRLAVGALATELAAKRALEAEVGESHARRALTTGALGLLWTTSKVLAAATLVCAATARGPRGRWLAAALGTAAALAGRFAVHEAGKRSARDPRAAFEPARRG